jgi:gluconokinase
MGVSGCGKTTVGHALSQRQNWPFIEGDDHHPAANIAKMAAGTPLTDNDRAAWVQAIVDAVDRSAKGTIVLACSALTPFVQNGLRRAVNRSVLFVLLEHQFDAIHARLSQRDHFMPPALLQSQFDALIPPQNAIIFDARLSPDELAAAIADTLSRDNAQTPSKHQLQ